MNAKFETNVKQAMVALATELSAVAGGDNGELIASKSRNSEMKCATVKLFGNVK